MIKIVIYFLLISILFASNLSSKGMSIDTQLMMNVARAIKTDNPQLLINVFKTAGSMGKDYHDYFDQYYYSDPARTMLMAAADFGHAAVVQLLVSLGINVDLKNKNGMHALMFATKKCNLEVMKLLIKGGADLNSVDNKHQSVLKYAVSFDKIEAAKLLVSLGANIMQKDKQGRDAVDLAILLGHSEIAKFLQETLQTRRNVLKQELSNYVSTGVDQIIMGYSDC